MTVFAKSRCGLVLAVSTLFLSAPQVWAADVNVSQPAPGSTVTSPFALISSCGVSGANAIQAYLDGNEFYNANAVSMNDQVTAAEGTHQLVVKCWVGSASYTSTLTITVVAPSAAISAPAPNSMVTSPFNIAASCQLSDANAIQAYLDGTEIYNADATSMNAQVTGSLGAHQLVVKCWAGSASYQSTETITVGAPPANVSVSSPAANSTVTSPFTVVGSCGVSGANAIQAYLDGAEIYNANATSMTDQVTASNGAHQLEVKCWVGANAYSSGVLDFTVAAASGFDGSVNIPNPPQSADDDTGIERLSGWSSATGATSSCANGVPSATCNPPNAIYNSTVPQSADPLYLPGSSGSSAVFELDQSPAWATAIWTHSLFTSTAARNFIWDFDVYVNASNYYASELDLYTTLNSGQRFMMGSQCNRALNSWDVWSESSQKWIPNMSVPCNSVLTPGSWHHITFYNTVDSTNNTYNYHVLRIDGVDYVLDQTQSTQYVGWPEGLIGIQVQLDTNASGTGVNEFIENTQLYAW